MNDREGGMEMRIGGTFGYLGMKIRSVLVFYCFPASTGVRFLGAKGREIMMGRSRFKVVSAYRGSGAVN